MNPLMYPGILTNLLLFITRGNRRYNMLLGLCIQHKFQFDRRILNNNKSMLQVFNSLRKRCCTAANNCVISIKRERISDRRTRGGQSASKWIWMIYSNIRFNAAIPIYILTTLFFSCESNIYFCTLMHIFNYYRYTAYY